MPEFGACYALAGIGILGLTLTDLGVTILRLDGPGPITGRISLLLWRMLLKARERRWISHRQLSYASPWLLMLFLSIWCGLTWLAWSLIFRASGDGLVEAQSGLPIDPQARRYFVGQTLSTLGVSEIQPRGERWQMLSSLCGLNGFFLLTLTVTYLLPLYDAAVTKRSMARHLSGLGGSPEGVLRGKWAEPEFREMLRALTEGLVRLSVIHRAYPMLHFFHSAVPQGSLSLQVAILDEAISHWECGAAPVQRLPRSVHDPLRKAIHEFLLTVSPMHHSNLEDIPPAHPLANLVELGMEVVSESEYQASMARLSERRSQLKDMVQGHGWSWKLVRGEAGE